MCTIPRYMGSLYVHSPRGLGWKGLLITSLLAVVVVVTMSSRWGFAAEKGSETDKKGPAVSDNSQVKRDGRMPWAGNNKIPGFIDGQDDGRGALTQMLVYSVIIVILGVVAIVVIKKFLPKIQRSGGKNLSIIETAYISPRSSVHLLGVGTKKYLISRSGEGVSLLAEVTEAVSDEQ